MSHPYRASPPRPLERPAPRPGRLVLGSLAAVGGITLAVLAWPALPIVVPAFVIWALGTRGGRGQP